MSVQVPHGWDNPDGTRQNGRLLVVLCPSCHADDPAAGPLITFFHVHAHVAAGNLYECADLITRWVASITIPSVDLEQLDAEYDAWRRGEL